MATGTPAEESYHEWMNTLKKKDWTPEQKERFAVFTTSRRKFDEKVFEVRLKGCVTEEEKKAIAKEAKKQRRKATRKVNRALGKARNLPECVTDAKGKISTKTVQQPEKKKKKEWYKKKDKGAGLVSVNSVEVDAIVDRGVKKWKEAFLEGMELAARRDGRQDSTR